MYKRYVPYSGTPGRNFLKFDIDYTLGGRSYFSWDNVERGIWMYIRSVEKGTQFESYTMFWESKDRKRLLVPLKRANSKLIAKIADHIFNHFTDEDFIEYYEYSTGIIADELNKIELGHSVTTL